ncbi:MAG: transcription antitermination factor NusB [Pseudomonadota bacterium]|nr:transcription antitermination factor NusB [Pseudomonadota bacterium]
MARKGSRGVRRRGARLAAVQAMYQMEIAGKSSAEAVEDFRLRRLNDTVDGGDGITPENVDEELFVSLVDGVSASIPALDAQIDQAISKERSIENVEVLLRLILRAGAYEISNRLDIDAALSINEYVAVAEACFGGREPRFVNGVLDRLAQELTPTKALSDVQE